MSLEMDYHMAWAQNPYRHLEGKRVRVKWAYGTAEGVLETGGYRNMIVVGRDTIGGALIDSIDVLDVQPLPSNEYHGEGEG